MKIMKKTLCILITLLFISFQIAEAQEMELSYESIEVSGACKMCKERIEKAAMTVKGVKSSKWVVEKQILFVGVVNDSFDVNKLHEVISGVGHDTNLMTADLEVYNNLPMCCHYRSPDNPHYLENKTKEISGIVYERDDNGDLKSLVGANLFWVGTSSGTISDQDGKFSLPILDDNKSLVVSYVGYKTDTVSISFEKNADLEIILSNSINLDAVQINYRKRATEFSRLDPIKVQKIGEGELRKAACCNLSESFQTTPSIDVSFTDAVTGVRKIEMLGLAGKYVQITRESMPDIRALSSINGLSYTPGHWIEGIQLNMGTGSVANGFESMTGQINVELRKPENSDPIFLNLYGNIAGRMEANLNISNKISKKVSTALLLHGNVKNNKSDRNNDGFLDKPIGNQLILVNRWKIAWKNGIKSQIGIKTMLSNQLSGQVNYDNYTQNNRPWVADLKTNRVEGWLKVGKMFADKPYASLGFQLSAVYHDQKNSYGLRTYDALQKSLYANLIYQSIFSNTNHKYRLGVSYQMDKVDETVSDLNYDREEHVPGTFIEYTYKPDDKFTLVGGFRFDWHNDFGFFYTPRLNLKYALSEKTIFRFAAGKGQRTANIFAENKGYFASARKFFIYGNNAKTPYGLEMEEAWNFGLNIIQQFTIFGKEFVFNLDGYHTRFENQIVVDIENPDEVVFYNLDGQSFSNSIQAQIDFSIIKNLDLKIAYRYNDVKTDYKHELLAKPLSSKHRAFLNIGYETSSKWKFDATINWQGQKRIPLYNEPSQHNLNNYSPDFYMLNAQISKEWSDIFELYVGAENILNYRQNNPILGSDNPFGNSFDASLVWGPILGRNVYFGIRYKIK